MHCIKQKKKSQHARFELNRITELTKTSNQNLVYWLLSFIKFTQCHCTLSTLIAILTIEVQVWDGLIAIRFLCFLYAHWEYLPALFDPATIVINRM